MGVRAQTATKSTDKTVYAKVINIKLLNPSILVIFSLFMALDIKDNAVRKTLNNLQSLYTKIV